MNGGLSSGGIGTCKMGREGEFSVRGSVTPGIDGIRGGKDNAVTPRAEIDTRAVPAVSSASIARTCDPVIGRRVGLTLCWIVRRMEQVLGL